MRPFRAEMLKRGAVAVDPHRMEIVGQIGVLVFLASFGATGGRLLFRGMGRDAVFERLLGISYFCGGPLGYVPMGLASSSLLPDAWDPALEAFGRLNFAVSAVALYLFNRRVFRPDSQRWRVVTLALCAAVGACWLGLVIERAQQGVRIGDGIFHTADFWLRAAAYVWAASESLHQFVLTNRRFRIGLADPVLVDRFRLWGIGMSAIVAMFAVALFFPGGPTPLLYVLNGLLAAGSTTAIWISFFPPIGYRERISARVPVQEAAS